jgi:uncharacterized repeat protein (TIGR03803 family)
LYGTASSGGSSGNGTVYKVNTDGTDFRILHSFTVGTGPYPATNTDGATPAAILSLSGNTLYGTARGGGSSGNGTVFKVNVDGTGFMTVHVFEPAVGGFYLNSEGAFPSGVTLVGNTLYGVATGGGDSGRGTIFKVNVDGASFMTLHSFSNGDDGADPYARLVLSSDTMYGVTAGGGAQNAGTVFKFNTNGTGFTTLHAFTSFDGAGPFGELILSSDVLYGTASSAGGSGNGTVFRVNVDGTDFRTLHSFPLASGSSPSTNSDGANPRDLILSGNILYGTASNGGGWGNGTVFKVNTSDTSFTTLHSFTVTSGSSPASNNDGANPFSGLVLSGNTLYGTAHFGGASGYGTVYRISLPPPQLTVMPSAANVILTWPTDDLGFHLQSTTNLVCPAFWSVVTLEPVVLNGQNVVTNPISGARQFYRLSQ